MSSKWPKEHLAKLVTIKGGKRLPAGKSLQQEPNSHPYIRVRDVGHRDLPRTGLEYVPDDLFPPISRYIVQPNDVVLSIVGTIGALSIVDAYYNLASLTENCVKLHGLGREDALYLFYYLSSAAGQLEIHRGTVGAVQPKLPIYNIEKIAVPWPDSFTRAAIAEILGSLDDRIALLRDTNATLEAIAQAIFKSWFVDFDPVRAKQEGRAPEGMDEATAALFPDSFEESALGLVPRGWRYSTVGESFVLTMGQSPPGDTYNESGDGLPFYQGRTDFGFRFPSQRVFCTAPTRLARPGDTLVSVRAPVGDVNMALEDCCLGRGVAGVRHPRGYRSFAFYATRGLRSKFDLFDSEGTVFGSINKKDFQGLPVVAPLDEVLAAFDHVATPIDQRVIENEGQIRVLIALRDTLLPRLISGQLRLPDAEDAIAEAAA
jgi:type I restriction enzyme S subunit